MVLVVPIVIAVLMLALQAAVYFHTSNVAEAAASQGAAAGAVRGESTFDIARRATDAAVAMLADAGVRAQLAPQVSVSAESVSVLVEVQVPTIVPIFPSLVRRVAVEPRERFLTEPMR